MALFNKREFQPEDYNRLVDKHLPNAQSELSNSDYDEKLGLNMARDARKVIDGKLKIEQFHKMYSHSLTEEFGDLFEASNNDVKGSTGDGRKWVMVIDLQKCVGCDTCTVSCKAENRTPPGITYNVVMEEIIGDYPSLSIVNLPRPCMQCDKPPCVQVCPTRATYKMENGIVTIDNDRCIGCRYCIVACPYGARSYDFGHSYEDEMIGFNDVTSPEYGVDRGERKKRKTPIGTVRKCSFCYHRLERGEEPACVETCIGDARYIGDINDPNSVVAKLAASPRAFRLKEELGTEPNVIYLR